MALRFDGETYYIDELAAITKVTQARNESPHTHQFVELVYILRGKCVQSIDGVDYPAARGHLLLINEGQRHSMVCQPGTEYINILMKPQLISQSMGHSGNAFSLLMLKDFSDFKHTVNQDNCCILFSGTDRDRLETLLQWLLQEQRENRSGSPLVLRAGLNMVLVQMFRKMALPMHRSDAGINDGLLAYLREHCAQRITLEETAESCGYEPSYFSRLFKRYTGKTFTRYIADCRMDKACSLLENTQKPVETIISECGFSDRTKFFQLFSLRTGMTPLAFRKSKN